MNCSKFQIKVLTGPLAGFIITDANYDSFIAENGGNGYTYAVMYGNTPGVEMNEPDMIIYADSKCSGVAPDEAVAYYGIADADEDVLALTDEDVEAATAVTYSEGGTITADFTGNSDNKILWMAELATEPVKTKWFTTTDGSNDIGAEETFDYQTGGATTLYRIIKTTFATAITTDPVEFRVL